MDLRGTLGRSVLLRICDVVAFLVTMSLVLNGNYLWMHSTQIALQIPRYMFPLRTRQDTPVVIRSCTGHDPVHAQVRGILLGWGMGVRALS